MTFIKNNIFQFIFLLILTSCEKQQTQPIVIQGAPQQNCEILTVTGIGNCVVSAQCPMPNRLCETVINNVTMTYSCNPIIGQQQRVCR